MSKSKFHNQKGLLNFYFFTLSVLKIQIQSFRKFKHMSYYHNAVWKISELKNTRHHLKRRLPG